MLDPTYLLPAICGALASGSVHDVVMAMEGGGLAYAVMAAAAKHEPLRRLGYQVPPVSRTPASQTPNPKPQPQTQKGARRKADLGADTIRDDAGG